MTAQIVADVFGLTPAAIRVDAGLDTGKDAWSIAAGNYSSRFAGATAGAAYIAATRLKGRLAHVAAAQLNLRPEDLCFAGGRVFATSNPENSLSFARVAAASHWSPGSLPAPEPREAARALLADPQLARRLRPWRGARHAAAGRHLRDLRGVRGRSRDLREP